MNQRSTNVYGERNGQAKLTDHECELMVTIHRVEKLSYGKLAKMFEVSKSSVYYICKGRVRGVACD